VSPEEVALARQALRSAEGCARRLARSHGKLSAQFLLSAARVTALPPDVEDDLDAFLKRYEQLVNSSGAASPTPIRTIPDARPRT